MNLDDNVLTKMVDAAAKGHYERARESTRQAFAPQPMALPEWEDLPPLEKNRWRQQILMPVWDAVAAMPDPRHTAWEEGRVAGEADAEERSSGADAIYPHQNPYPSPEVAL